MKRLLGFAALAAIALLLLAPAVRAGLFQIGSTYQVSGTNFPTDFGPDAVTLDGTTKLINGGLLSLSETFVPDATGEWIQFNLATTNGGPLAGDLQALWQMRIRNVALNQPSVLSNAYIYWDANGVAFSPLTLIGNAIAVGPSPIGPSVPAVLFLPGRFGPRLFSNPTVTETPYAGISNGGIDPSTANGFHFGLHASPVPEPATAVLLAVGCAAAGLVRVTLRWKPCHSRTR
jgi:hypothetical protein